MRRRDFLKGLALLPLGAAAAAVASTLPAGRPVPLPDILPRTRGLAVRAEKEASTGDTVVSAHHRVYHQTYALGFRVTEDMLRDDLGIVKKMSHELDDALHDHYLRLAQDTVDGAFGVNLWG